MNILQDLLDGHLKSAQHEAGTSVAKNYNASVDVHNSRIGIQPNSAIGVLRMGSIGMHINKEYTLIRKRTLSEPHIIILFTGTMLACQHYYYSHDGAMERWPVGEIGRMEDYAH